MDDEAYREGGSEENEELVPRGPTVEDLRDLCTLLNGLAVQYVVVGGFAVRGSGLLRNTMDIDFIISTDPENEAKVYEALRSLPDKAVDDLDPGDVAKYTVVRVADEIIIDLMQSASGIDYAEASKDVVIRKIGDVEIPFASPRLLYRMKVNTHREKDAADLVFLRRLLEENGESIPE